MQAQTLESAELGEAWIEGEGDARWRSASAHGAGAETLRFVAVYASPRVTTTYERDVQPDGGRERDSTA